MLLWIMGTKHGCKIYQNTDQKAMRILNANNTDLLWKVVPKKRPGSSNNRTKNKANHERDKCMKKGDAEDAEVAGGSSKT